MLGKDYTTNLNTALENIVATIIPIKAFLKLLSLRLFSRGITFKFTVNRILWELSINNGYVLLILCKTNLQCSQIFLFFDEYILHLFYANVCSSLHLYLINISYNCNVHHCYENQSQISYAAYRFALNYNHNNEWGSNEIPSNILHLQLILFLQRLIVLIYEF